MQRGLNFRFKNLKINLLISFQFVIAAVFITRLFFIQVVQHDKYRVMAEEQYWNLQDIPAKRGDILSSDGFPLATTQVSYLLYGEPHKITDPMQVANDIAEILVRSRSQYYKDDNQKEALFNSYNDRFYDVLSLDLRWVALEHFLSDSERLDISNLGVNGIGFEEEPRRYYPEGELASHILGFVARNKHGEEQGYFGIEGSLDGDLRGRSGRVIEEMDATGAPILIGGYKRVDPIDGRTATLTVNRAVQYLVEKRLGENVKKYGAVSGSVIVMNPFTGDVLAMANFPTYHPAYFDDQIELDSDSDDNGEMLYTTERRNLAISETYEPGSVLKALTISSGIDIKKITPNTTFEDNGPVSYSGYTIDNWNGKHYGTQNVIQLLQKSNNVGAVWVGHLVGSKALHNYFTKFGIGSLSGISLEGEDTGILRDFREWTDIDLATAAFGQGVSATPLQVLNAVNVIANGGELMRPRIVEKVVQGEKIVEIPMKSIGRVISRESAVTMSELLTKAVSGGESKYFNIKNYEIAGKTGTAQIPVGGKYDPDKTNATFVGFLSNSKKFSMIVRLDRPSSSVYAAETAVPLWMSIANDLIKYYGIPPDTGI